MANELPKQILNYLKKEEALITKIDIAQPFLINNDTQERRLSLDLALRDLEDSGMIKFQKGSTNLTDTTAGEFSVSLYHTGYKATITDKGLAFIKTAEPVTEVKKTTEKYLDIDNFIRASSAGIIYIAEDSSDEHYDMVHKCLQMGLLNEVDKSIFRVSEKGKEVIAAGGYNEWYNSKKTKAEKINDILLDGRKNQIIGLSKEDSDEYVDLVHYAHDKGFLTTTTHGNYRLSALGQDILDFGGYPAWLLDNSSNTPPTKILFPIENHYHGHVTNISDIDKSRLTVNNSRNNTTSNVHNLKSSNRKNFPDWFKYTLEVIAALIAIITFLYFIGILKHT